jgi:hypothetical protein
VSLAPGSYFFCAAAGPVHATAKARAIVGNKYLADRFMMSFPPWHLAAAPALQDIEL